MTTERRPKPTMPESLVLAYRQIIRTGCEGVERGGVLIRDVSDSIRTDSGEYQAVQCWDGILLVITHAAALSRLLWPQRLGRTPQHDNAEQAARRLRGEQLRIWLYVQADSPLNAAGREVRDTVEHWDERVETWHLDSVGKKMIAWAIGGVGDLDPAEYYCVRSFDPDTMTVTYGRHILDLRPLLAEVDRLWTEYNDQVALGA